GGVGEDERERLVLLTGLVEHRATVVGEGQMARYPGIHASIAAPLIGRDVERHGARRQLCRASALPAPSEQRDQGDAHHGADSRCLHRPLLAELPDMSPDAPPRLRVPRDQYASTNQTLD